MRGPPSLLVVTGTRADFGLWHPVLGAARDAAIPVRLLVMGMHLDGRFGRTVDEVRRSGFSIAAEVPATAQGDSRAGMSIALGRAIQGVTPSIEHEMPDWLLVLGDRGEQLAAALAALHLGVRVAHVHGGERTLGAVDDAIRDMISRVAALHLVAHGDALARLIHLGVVREAIKITGAPGLDVIASRSQQDASVRERHGVASEPYLLLVQHPETVGDSDPVTQLEATLDAIGQIRLRTIAIFPNADAGGRAMGERLAVAEDARFRTHRSLSHHEFIALLAGAAALVGNSSSGIIEAPMLGIPAVNIGRRQEGRIRGDNVIDVPADSVAIHAALLVALTPKFRASLSGTSPYGDGNASERIIAELIAATSVESI